MPIEDKIIKIDGDSRHYYNMNIQSRVGNYGYYQNTTPYELSFNGLLFNQNSWNKLIPAVIDKLLDIYPEKERCFRMYSPDWSGARTAVSSVKLTSTHNKIRDGLYLSWDSTTIHSVWTLIDMLKLFDIDLTAVTLIVHRPSGAENKDTVREYSEKYIAFFKEHLRSRNVDNDSIIRYVNDIFPRLMVKYKKISPPTSAYPDLFAIDNMPSVYNYVQKKLSEQIKTALYASEGGNLLLEEELRCIEWIVETYRFIFNPKARKMNK